MTKTLTEKWQKGTLPNGDYYLKVCGNLTGKEFFVYDNCINGKWKYTLDRNVIDVIAPVPSYEEYKNLQEENNKLADLITDINNKWLKTIKERKHLEKRLEIATKALIDIRNNSVRDWDEYSCRECSVKALKEMEGVK